MPRLYERREKEQRERDLLAPWAMRSADSRGRRFPEPDDELRTCWERDRDRVVHCTAFRRLGYKTQVFVNWEGDHHRTRLSHSLEVAQVARSVGSALFLNEPLCEALALSHDIGHPPFGHRGEWALNELMGGHGGFRHNAQVLRVVDRLERRSPDYPGLNLTRELRESLLKHESDEDWPDEFLPRPQRPCVEAQVVDLADSTAYNVHDVEDGLRAGMFDEPAIRAGSGLWRRAEERIAARHPGFLDERADSALRVKRVANEMLGVALNDLIEATAANLEDTGLDSHAAVQAHDRSVVVHTSATRKEIAELHGFLYERFYRHEHLQLLTEHSREVLSGLFEALRAAPAEMAPWYHDWIDEVGPERAVCDYVAGMTDRFAESEYERLTGRVPALKVEG